MIRPQELFEEYTKERIDSTLIWDHYDPTLRMILLKTTENRRNKDTASFYDYLKEKKTPYVIGVLVNDRSYTERQDN